jgi:putative transcriptional regulator
MATVRFKLDPASAPPLDPETLAHLAALDSLSAETLESRALSDPDNPPMTDEELARLAMAAAVRDARVAARLSQAAFAKTYRFTIGRLRDLEQGRTRPDSAMLAYLSLIRRDPEGVKAALEAKP